MSPDGIINDVNALGTALVQGSWCRPSNIREFLEVFILRVIVFKQTVFIGYYYLAYIGRLMDVLSYAGALVHTNLGGLLKTKNSFSCSESFYSQQAIIPYVARWNGEIHTNYIFHEQIDFCNLCIFFSTVKQINNVDFCNSKTISKKQIAAKSFTVL